MHDIQQEKQVPYIFTSYLPLLFILKKTWFINKTSYINVICNLTQQSETAAFISSFPASLLFMWDVVIHCMHRQTNWQSVRQTNYFSLSHTHTASWLVGVSSICTKPNLSDSKSVRVSYVFYKEHIDFFLHRLHSHVF